jgi:Zn-finger protein
MPFASQFPSKTRGSAGRDLGWSSDEEAASEAENERKVLVGSSLLPRKLSYLTMAECPVDENGQWISLGSKKHAIGSCTPCKWFRCNKGCKDAALCKNCHYTHEELTYHAIKSKMRRARAEKRRFFESGTLLKAMCSIKNTFIHLEDDDEENAKDTEVAARPSSAR